MTKQERSDEEIDHLELSEVDLDAAAGGVVLDNGSGMLSSPFSRAAVSMGQTPSIDILTAGVTGMKAEFYDISRPRLKGR